MEYEKQLKLADKLAIASFNVIKSNTTTLSFFIHQLEESLEEYNQEASKHIKK